MDLMTTSTSTRRSLRTAVAAALATGALLTVGAAGSAAFASSGGPFGTHTTLSSSQNPTLVGQALTITATVGSSHTSTPPTGNITFNLPDGLQCSAGNVVALSYQMAQCSIPSGVAQSGKLTVTAGYSGGGNFLPSTSRRLTELVEDQATTVTVTPSVDPAVTGQPVSFTATFTPASQSDGLVSGNVVFKTLGAKGKRYSCSGGSSVPIVSDTATCTISRGFDAQQGSYAVTASMDPKGQTTSGSADVVVTPSPTNVAVSVSPSTIKSGEDFTITANVSAVAPATGDPTGTVDFTICQIDNGTCIGGPKELTATDYGTVSYTVDGGQPVDPDTQLTAIYEGDSDYSYSLDEVTVKIGLEPVKVVLSSSENPSNSGDQVSFTAAVTADTGNSAAVGPPTGTVNFTISGGLTCEGGTNDINLDTSELNQGVATCTIASGQMVSSGSPYTVTADYPSDGNYANGHASLSQTVS